MRKGPGQVKMEGVFIRPQSTIPNPPPIARPVTTDERDSWLAAASYRNPPRPRDVQTMRNWLRSRGPKRYALLALLIRWAEREFLDRQGIYPEDARWLLP